MPKTQAERSKARRIRRKTAPTAEETEWLARYEKSGTRSPPSTLDSSQPTLPDALPKVPQKTPSGPSSPPNSPQPAAPEPQPAAPTTKATADLVPLPPSFFGGVDRPTSHAASACSVKDCPACRAEAEAEVCGVTGKKVYAPMSEAGSQGLAALVLLGLGVIIIALRKDRQLVPPTEAERTQLASALREVAYRRFNRAGQADDLLALGWVLGAYTMRAVRAPQAPAKKPAKKTGDK